MLISDIQKVACDEDIFEIRDEKEFDRFSRTTSFSNVPVCVYIGSERYIRTIPDNATMVITSKEIAEKIENDSYGLCISNDPKASYFRLFKAAAQVDTLEKNSTVIGDNCQIGKNVSISEWNVKIGNNVVIEDFVTIYENVEIGNDCIIRSGAKLGVQDYNYFRDKGDLIHLPHYGSLVLEANVEVGFNSVVGKSLYPGDKTIIGYGSKLANCCAVGHDCKLGKRVMIYAGTMLAGFVEVGDDTHITLNSTIKNGIRIGKNVTVNMGSVVIRDINDGEVVFGNPAKKIIAPR
jgi:UDP-3-O-[3-hydroxymyristoyl] glucosamine N-acyltransferase LpxD